MGTNDTIPAESEAVWEQLLRLAEGGDIRAIKLYYDMLEKKQRTGTGGGCVPGGGSAIEQMAEIRRAVFGEAAVMSGAAAMSDLSAVMSGTAGYGAGGDDSAAEMTEEDGD